MKSIADGSAGADVQNAEHGTDSAISKTSPQPDGIDSSASNVLNSGLKNPLESMRQITERMNEEWKTPISFYGRVVDERNEPVAGASISFLWSDLSSTGTSKAQGTSDENGLFSLVGRNGRGLSVGISKPGYSLQKRGSQLDFEYAREVESTFYRPDPNNPVIFRLRKKGPGAELITSRYGVLPDMEFSTPRDGTPVRIDFFNRKSGNDGQMELMAIKPERNPNDRSAKEWAFRISIPDGGLIEHDDEFPFEAPESGYQPVIEFHFKPGEPSWKDSIRKRYYIAFGQPRKFGRIEIETSMYWGVHLSYAINPDGSRYLEPKEPTPVKRELPPGVTERVPGPGE